MELLLAFVAVYPVPIAIGMSKGTLVRSVILIGSSAHRKPQRSFDRLRRGSQRNSQWFSVAIPSTGASISDSFGVYSAFSLIHLSYKLKI